MTSESITTAALPAMGGRAHHTRIASGAGLYARMILTALLITAVLVPLGAYVRLTDAGLGCPDWPGCYGRLLVAPDDAAAGAALQAGAIVDADAHGKAWREMAHRYVAGLLGFVILAATVVAWTTRRPPQVKTLSAILLGTVGLQAVLGMLTVTQLLHPLIVTLHLMGGITTLGLLWWLVLLEYGWLRPRTGLPVPGRGLKTLALTAFAVVSVQVFLGGWTSTNYAAIACVDFPTCQTEWWPEMAFDEGFTLSRGLGINYEYGVLDNPARVAIHFTHRLGALVVTLVLVTLAWRLAKASRPRLAAAVGTVLALQVALGIGNVVLGLPLAVAVSHNAGAAALVLTLLAVLHNLYGLTQSGAVRRIPSPA